MGQQDVPALELDSPEDHRIAPGTPRIIYSSPLKRALSAVDVMFPGEPAVVSDLLLERFVGDWEGMDHATVEAQWPGTFIDGVLAPGAEPPGGESVDELCTRVIEFFDLISAGDPGVDVYAVTHNGWIRAAMLLNGEISFDRLFAEPVPFLTPIRFTPTFGRT